MQRLSRSLLWLFLLCLAARPAMACCVAEMVVPDVHEVVSVGEAGLQALPPCHQQQAAGEASAPVLAAHPAADPVGQVSGEVSELAACPGCADCLEAQLTPPGPLELTLKDAAKPLALLTAAMSDVPEPALRLMLHATGPPDPLLLAAQTPVTLKQRLLN